MNRRTRLDMVMAPSTLRRRMISELRKTVLAMMSAEWDIALEGKPAAEVTRAGRTLLALQRARLRLGTAELAGIRDQLRENERELVKAMAALGRARKKLRGVKTVLVAAASLLRTVGRIIDIVV